MHVSTMPNYLQVVLRCPVKMERKLLEQIQAYSDWVELQEKMQGTLTLKPEWLT